MHLRRSISIINDNLNKSTNNETYERLLNIQDLPFECKLAIFSHLNPRQKIKCQRVCKEWRELLKDQFLWKKIDLAEVVSPLKTCDESKMSSDSTNQAAEKRKMTLENYYETEKKRVLGYFNFLCQLKAKPTELNVCLDIGDMQDHWVDTLKTFLDCSNLSSLKKATTNWKETPWKPFPDSFYTWSNSNYSDLIYKHRRRQRYFISFFDSFTAQAKNIEYLNIPFDWSSCSVSHLCRLGNNLKELVLTEYFVPQSFDQCLLDKLLSSLPKLEKLTVNIVFGSGLGLVGYEFNSKSLKYLNLSNCKGIAIRKIDLPRLEILSAGHDTFLSHYLGGSDEKFNRKRFQTNSRMCQSLSSEPNVIHSSLSSRNKKFLKTTSFSSLLPEPLLFSSSHTIAKQKDHLETSSNVENVLPESSESSEVFTNNCFHPCLLDVIRQGAPQLKQLNNYHFTHKTVSNFIDPLLNKVLLQTCFCNKHSLRTV